MEHGDAVPRQPPPDALTRFEEAVARREQFEASLHHAGFGRSLGAQPAAAPPRPRRPLRPCPVRGGVAFSLPDIDEDAASAPQPHPAPQQPAPATPRGTPRAGAVAPGSGAGEARASTASEAPSPRHNRGCGAIAGAYFASQLTALAQAWEHTAHAVASWVRPPSRGRQQLARRRRSRSRSQQRSRSRSGEGRPRSSSCEAGRRRSSQRSAQRRDSSDHSAPPGPRERAHSRGASPSPSPRSVPGSPVAGGGGRTSASSPLASPQQRRSSTDRAATSPRPGLSTGPKRVPHFFL